VGLEDRPLVSDWARQRKSSLVLVSAFHCEADSQVSTF